MTIQQINQLVQEGEALKTIAAAYTEISALRLRKIRQQVLKTRAFFVEVLNIHAMLKHIVLQKRKPETFKGDLVNIVLTSNNRFYGHIESDLIKFFLSQRKLGDIFVVGKIGKEDFTALGFTFTPIILKDDVPSPQELKELVDKVKKYQAILIYYSRFQSVVNQTPVVVDITQSQAKAAVLSEKLEELYIFEPEVPKILDFFDTQLKQVLIEQTFLETELARTASKLISMDKAQQNADEFIKNQNHLLSQAKRSIKNARILEIIASLQSKERRYESY